MLKCAEKKLYLYKISQVNYTVIRPARLTGGEDFSEYLKQKPGCFAFVGARNTAIGADKPHHNGCFNVDESVFKDGAALYAQYAPIIAVSHIRNF